MGLVLYVSRNPLEAGIVSDGRELERFPWCGLGALMGRCSPRPFESVTETLALFDSDPQRARQRLRVRLDAPARDDMPAPASFTPTFRARAEAEGFEALLIEVCADYSLAPSELRSRRRTARIAAARRDIALRAAAGLGLSGSEIARRLGLTSAAVSAMLARQRASGPTI